MSLSTRSSITIDENFIDCDNIFIIIDENLVVIDMSFMTIEDRLECGSLETVSKTDEREK